MLTEKVGKLILAQEVAKGNIWRELVAFELGFTQLIELEDVRH